VRGTLPVSLLGPLRSESPDWEEVKEDVMRRALRAKFTQHDDLRVLLLETGEAVIVENAPGDLYWGIGRDGTGKNRLGALLMELREAANALRTGARRCHAPVRLTRGGITRGSGGAGRARPPERPRRRGGQQRAAQELHP